MAKVLLNVDGWISVLLAVHGRSSGMAAPLEVAGADVLHADPHVVGPRLLGRGVELVGREVGDPARPGRTRTVSESTELRWVFGS